MQTLRVPLRLRWLPLGLLLATSHLLCAAETPSARWEPAIKAFEAADAKSPPPRDGVLFVGSSSIRLWKTLASDFPQTSIIQRGFGGSQMVDLLAYADRIILPYQPRLIVVYEGDNDLAAGKSPEEILLGYKQLVERVHEQLPQTRMAFIAIKPSLARWHLEQSVRLTNRLIQEFSNEHDRLEFVDVFTPMLNEEGKPRGELFVEDGLHLNLQGYQLWTRLLSPFVRVRGGSER